MIVNQIVISSGTSEMNFRCGHYFFKPFKNHTMHQDIADPPYCSNNEDFVPILPEILKSEGFWFYNWFASSFKTTYHSFLRHGLIEYINEKAASLEAAYRYEKLTFISYCTLT